MAGVNPWTAAAEDVERALDFVPLVRIDPHDGPLEPGPDDPGGRAWILRQAIALVASLVAMRMLGGVVGRLLGCRRRSA
jgi:hypothetical protein